MSHLRVCHASLTRIKVAQIRAALYSENESRDCATRHVTTYDTPCHTCDFDALSHVKVACDISLKTIWNLMKQEMMGWQWHQLDYMQIICTLLCRHLITQFLRGRILFLTPTNSVQALKAMFCFKTSRGINSMDSRLRRRWFMVISLKLPDSQTKLASSEQSYMLIKPMLNVKLSNLIHTVWKHTTLLSL